MSLELELADIKKRFEDALTSVKEFTDAVENEVDVFERISTARKLGKAAHSALVYALRICHVEEKIAEEKAP